MYHGILLPMPARHTSLRRLSGSARRFFLFRTYWSIKQHMMTQYFVNYIDHAFAKRALVGAVWAAPVVLLGSGRAPGAMISAMTCTLALNFLGIDHARWVTQAFYLFLVIVAVEVHVFWPAADRSAPLAASAGVSAVSAFGADWGDIFECLAVLNVATTRQAAGI